MPCRCDDYPVGSYLTDTARHDLEKKLEHVEGQLCNAQSLIHRLLKYIDAQRSEIKPSLYVPLDPALRERAEQHVKVLLEHKRAESGVDRRDAKQRLAELEGHREQDTKRVIELQKRFDQSLDELRASTAKRDAEIAELRKQAFGPTPTDEELLG